MKEACLSRAMEQHGNAVYALALCQLQSSEDADHVFEEVFESFAQQRNAEHWKQGQTKSWLLRMTVDLGKTRSSEVIHLTEAREQQKHLGALWAAVSRLPLEQRLVFHLSYGEELGPDTVAEILSMSKQMVKVHLNRARNTVRREMKSNERIS